jgi:hypothetical protein
VEEPKDEEGWDDERPKKKVQKPKKHAPTPTLNPGIRNTTIAPSHTLNNSDFSHITDGFLTTSALLYVLGPRNITVIEPRGSPTSTAGTGRRSRSSSRATTATSWR